MDESGDLGFTDKASRYFIVAYVITESHERISVEVKRLLKKINLHARSNLQEFKFGRDRELIRHKFLNLISKLDFDGGKVIINKTAVRSHLRDKKSVFYNYVIADNISRTILKQYDEVRHVNLHLDLSMSVSSRNHFNSYFSNKMSWLSSIVDLKQTVTNRVDHVYSHNEPCIQIADYLAGSLFRSYEREDSRYYEMIKHKIRYTYGWGQ